MNEDPINVDEQQPADLPWGAVVSDGDLIRQFAAYRDQQAFEELVNRHGPLVLGVCRRILRHEQDVEDAFQATFLVLARRAAGVRWQTSLANWLYGVAYRTALKARVRRTRLTEAPLRNPEMIAADDSSRESRTMPSPEFLRLLDENLHGLPDRYRAPLVLCYLQGKTRDEAAEELGLSVGAVKGRLERGREKLRQRLTKAGVTLPAALPILAGAVGESIVLPKSLAAATVDAALTFAEGHLAGAALSSQAVTLAQGELTMIKAVTTVKCLAAVLLVTGVIGGGLFAVSRDDSAQADEKTAKETQKVNEKPSLLGTWEVVSAQEAGRDDLEAVGGTFTFTPRTVTLRNGTQTIVAREYSLNPSGDPDEIDLSLPLPGKDERVLHRGIYELQNDQLKLAFVWRPDRASERPTEFVSRPRPDHHDLVVMTLRRKADPAETTKAAPADDKEDIQGTWSVLKAGDNGNVATGKELGSASVVITEDQIMLIVDKEVIEGPFPYRLDADQKPKTITFKPNATTPLLGIYELQGDQLQIVYNESPGDSPGRPTKFASEKGTPNDMFLVLARREQAEEDVSVAAMPPVVVKTVPQAGATDVSPDVTEIQVTFSKDMQDGSWSWSTAAGQEHFPETTGPPKYLEDQRTAVLPVKLQPGKTYAMWLNTPKFQNFKDADRRPAVPYLLVFQTKSGVE